MNDRRGTATYSPEDNKLRLYPDTRLSREDYNRVKAVGFTWAPKQELFVAPMWTPEREDLLIEWCGEVGDEDTSLVERAEQRADRFADYSDKRTDDAERARAGVAAIADGIPLGQPILVGHHSERRARKDAERIENGMRRAVQMWETAEYWKHRAKGAIRAAKYKERPDVRARRIKTLEASKRKQERNKAEAEQCAKFWRGECTLTDRATGQKVLLAMTEENKELILRVIGNSGMDYSRLPVAKKEGSDNLWEAWSAWHVLQPDGERYVSCPSCTVAQCVEAAERTYPPLIAHYERWIAHYTNRIEYERAMLGEAGGTAADRTGPEKGGAVKCWASVRGCWSYIQKVNKVSVTVLDNWGNGGENFTRTIPFDKCFEIMTAAEVQAARDAGRLVETSCKTGFGLLSDATATKATETAAERGDRQHAEAVAAKQQQAQPFEAMRETLKAGVQVVSAPQLFPTPPDIARQMVALAAIPVADPLFRLLEPSAGTGAILDEVYTYGGRIVAVEINRQLADALRVRYGAVDVHCADFLSLNGELGLFDRVLMNPPFANGADIRHIRHALTFLKPGGRLVAICANGPRQREDLEGLCEQWIDLPEGTFKEQGTNVSTALIVINH